MPASYSYTGYLEPSAANDMFDWVCRNCSDASIRRFSLRKSFSRVNTRDLRRTGTHVALTISGGAVHDAFVTRYADTVWY